MCLVFLSLTTGGNIFFPSLQLIRYFKCFKVTEQFSSCFPPYILECQLELDEYNGPFIAVIMVMEPVK